MGWRHLDGPECTVQVTIGAVAVEARDVVKASADTVVAIGDGELVAGVMHEDGAANATGKQMDLLMPGSIWEVTVASQTINREVKVAMAGTDTVDAGTQADPAVGKIVNAAVVDTDTKAQVLILGGTPTID